LSYRAILAFHRQKRADVTVALTRVDDCSRYGTIEMDDDCRITRFAEKCGTGRARNTIINGGVYVIEPKVLALIPAGKQVSFEREVLPRIIENGGKVFGYQTDGYFIDIGTPGDYAKALEELVKEGL